VAWDQGNVGTDLKAGIIKGGWHDIETNPLYQAFAQHCGFAIVYV